MRLIARDYQSGSFKHSDTFQHSFVIFLLDNDSSIETGKEWPMYFSGFEANSATVTTGVSCTIARSTF